MKFFFIMDLHFIHTYTHIHTHVLSISVRQIIPFYY